MRDEARQQHLDPERPFYAPVPVIEPPVETRTYRQLFDRETLADYLRLSTDTIDRLVKAKRLPCVRIGSQIRFTHQDVETFLAQSRSDRAASA
jgi:excisionase family DNA binding protein